MTTLANQAKRQLQIPQQMGQVDKSLSILTDRLGELRGKLAPIMRVQPPAPTTPTGETAKCNPNITCEIVGWLIEEQVKINKLADAVESITNLLEI